MPNERVMFLGASKLKELRAELRASRPFLALISNLIQCVKRLTW